MNRDDIVLKYEEKREILEERLRMQQIAGIIDKKTMELKLTEGTQRLEEELKNELKKLSCCSTHCRQCEINELIFEQKGIHKSVSKLIKNTIGAGGVLETLTTIFIVMKLIGNIDWSWFYVLLPFFIRPLLMVLLVRFLRFAKNNKEKYGEENK